VPDALQAKIVQIIVTPPKQVPKPVGLLFTSIALIYAPFFRIYRFSIIHLFVFQKYYAAVCPQLRDLMHVPLAHDRAEEYTRVAITAVGRMLERQPLLTKRFFLAPILEPLTAFARSSSPEPLPDDDGVDEDVVVVEEKTLAACLEDLDKIISANSANSTLASSLAEGSFAFFSIYILY
jgi:hypothetical protein